MDAVALTWLAVERQVSASMQNQALSAVLFLYKAVLAIEIGTVHSVVRARTPERLPVVLSREEIGETGKCTMYDLAILRSIC